MHCIDTTFLTNIPGNHFSHNICAVFYHSELKFLNLDPNWAKNRPLLLKTLDVSNCVDSGIVQWQYVALPPGWPLWADSEWKEHTLERTDSNLFFLAQNQLIGPHGVHWRQFWPSRGLSGAFLGPGWVLEHLRGPIFQIMKWTHFLWFHCSFCT